MKRRIVFAGCSFTWGQGLWSYWPNKDAHIPTAGDYVNNRCGIPDDAIRFRDEHRFPRLVCNKFGYCTPVVKRYNGSTDLVSIEFLEEVLKNNVTYDSHLTENVNKDEITDVVFQFTNLFRSEFTFDYKGNTYQHFHDLYSKYSITNKLHFHKNGMIEVEEFSKGNNDILLEWLLDNNFTIDDFIEVHSKKLHTKVESTLKKFESLGANIHITFMDDTHLENIFKNDYLASKIIKLKYNNEEYSTIMEMQNNYKDLVIATDDTFHFVDDDGHPSLKCHQIIADNIVEHIKKHEKKNYI